MWLNTGCFPDLSSKVVFLMTPNRMEKYALPRYAPEEAASYLEIPVPTLRSWVFGRHFPSSTGPRFWRPVIDLENPEVRLLSFFNLVEAHVLSAARYKHDVKMPEIRSALDYVKTDLGVARPLLDRRFSTDGKYLFLKSLESAEQWINASNWGQYALGTIIDQYLERIEWDDAGGFPIGFYPKTQGNDAKVIIINPGLSAGRPVVKGRGVLATIIWQRKAAGDSVETLARDYRLDQSQVEAALDYVERTCKAA
jgi:uncharacterized protein (DUF433 family)